MSTERLIRLARLFVFKYANDEEFGPVTERTPAVNIPAPQPPVQRDRVSGDALNFSKLLKVLASLKNTLHSISSVGPEVAQATSTLISLRPGVLGNAIKDMIDRNQFVRADYEDLKRGFLSEVKASGLLDSLLSCVDNQQVSPALSNQIATIARELGLIYLVTFRSPL